MPTSIPPNEKRALLAELTTARQRVAEIERALAGHDDSSPWVDDATFTRSLLIHLPDYVYFKDRERRFTRFSASFETLLGRPSSKIVGHRDEDLFPPNIAEATAEDDRRVIESGVPLVNKLEGGVVAPGVERWVLTTKLPWRDESGTICGLFGISRDITAQKRLEDAVRDNERRLRIISDTVPFPVAATRISDGEVLYGNRALADFLGIPLEQLVGSRIPDYYDDPQQRDALIARVQKEGRVEGVELHLRRHDGAVRVAASSVIPIEIDGAPALMGAGADITELKARERELEELGTQKDLLLREIDHRVRNNLATLAALIRQQAAAVEGPAREVLERLDKSIQSLATVHTMLSASGWEPIAITTLCQDVLLGTFRGLKSISKLSVTGAPTRVSSQAAHQLALVLAELATNSMKHGASKSGLEVTVHVEESQDAVRVVYRDNGVGYPRAVLDGTEDGLGLRLLRGLVGYGLRGRVALENDAGAMTTLHLPSLDGESTRQPNAEG